MMRLLREAGRLQEALHVCAGLRKTGGRPGGEEWRALTAAAAEAALRDGSTDLACKARLLALLRQRALLLGCDRACRCCLWLHMQKMALLQVQ